MKELLQISIPDTCPYCSSKLDFDGMHLTCPNEACSGKLKFKFIDAFSLLKIKGAGPAMLEEWFDNGFTDVFDLFDKNKFNIETLGASGVQVTKNTEKVLKEIAKKTAIDLHEVILMMGYKNMGVSTAKEVAKEMSGIKHDYTGLEKEVVTGWHEGGIKSSAVKNVLEQLSSCGISISYPKDESASVGVEFTGSPKPAFKTKDEFLKAIENLGFRHTVIKEASILVTDSYESTSSKMATAKKKGLEILTYTDFAAKYLK